MFISIKWKNAVVFTLMITAILSIICSLQIAGILTDARNEFKDDIYSVFTEKYIKDLQVFSENSSHSINIFDENGVLTGNQTFDNTEAVFDKISENSYALNLSKSRALYLLDADGNIINSTTTIASKSPQGSFDFVFSDEKKGFDMSFSHMDFYVKANTASGAELTACISDDNSKVSEYIKSTVFLYLKCLPLILIICFLMGLWLANSITISLQKLNFWAKQLSDGKIEIKNDVLGNDELGTLAKTLESMAHNLEASSAEITNEKIKLETILLNMTDGILAFNLDGKIIHINPEAQKLLGIQFLDDIVFDRFFKEIQADISMGELLYNTPEESVERNITIDKNKFLRLNFAPFSLKNKVGGIVVVIHDITKQQKLEQSRRDFVANVSHELRTPITTVKSYAETLADTPDAPQELTSQFLSVIVSESDRMVRIISDLLTLAELDDKNPVFKPKEQIDIKAMIRSVTERMQISAKQKNQTLLYSPINDVPVIVGDKDGLERVFINIISNALKYTPDNGEINIYTSCVYNDICIKVTDNGIGIPEEKLPHIFDRFYRVDKARSRGTGGTGLGLAIAKQTVESEFGGKIKISSKPGEGTEVSITLPVSERSL